MKAISKINLFLEILGKRHDGYHEIKTVFYPIDFIFDDIEIEESEPGIIIESDSQEIPSASDNLCWKAAAKFAEASGLKPRWKIKIKKRIPVSAGLGGGSSDAATVLKILSKLYPNTCEIRKIASELGADINFFIEPTLSLGEGVGEKLSKLNYPLKLPLLIVNPLFPITSAWAYKNYFSVSKISFEDFNEALKNGQPAKIAKLIRNDLAPAIYEKFPILEIIRQHLFDCGSLGAEISGSGSSIFAIFADEKQTLAAKEKINNIFNSQKNPAKIAVKLFTTPYSIF